MGLSENSRERAISLDANMLRLNVFERSFASSSANCGSRGEPFDDVGHHFDELSGDVKIGDDALHVRDETLQGELGDGGEQLLGAGEVVVDGPAGDAERVGDVGHRGLRRARSELCLTH